MRAERPCRPTGSARRSRRVACGLVLAKVSSSCSSKIARSSWRRFTPRVRTLSGLGNGLRRKNTFASAEAGDAARDDEGHDLGGGQVEDLALFIGAGETFQIWNPKLFLADANIPEDMKDIARFRLEERGIAL